ncbi:PREDICTED: uncharacterized protein LOC104589925 [Nelumbo nucifera]|uniref:Uncharacterized protein LOC104589925 n=1 Tax=Nelumbo nucifera TaxID=4432 RepID=A0A1U7ZGL3_NELNU|nr:PREDICTED: uncharacterized protein LOC104589925 [Nelumbo nucifera]
MSGEEEGTRILDFDDFENMVEDEDDLGDDVHILGVSGQGRFGSVNATSKTRPLGSMTKESRNFFMAKHPHLTWTPCAAHCLDLILEDIGKLSVISKTIERAIALTRYIYNHSGLLNLMRKYTNQRELLRPAKTHFVTSFLTLQSIYKRKKNLRDLFNSKDWNESKWVKEIKGRRLGEMVMMPTFWNNIIFTLKACSPLVRVLRLVDCGNKPSMCYVYEAMDRAKEAIASAFSGHEEKYKHIFEIIDKRWECQLHQPLHAAGFYLNPEFYYDDAEKINSDEEETITRLYKVIELFEKDKNKINAIIDEINKYKNADGVFGLDMTIWQKKVKVVDVTDPISLKDIDESNEWLLGEMAREVSGVENDLVLDDDSLTWGDVALALGVEEPIRNTRNRGSSVTSISHARATTSTNARRSRGGSSSQLRLENEEFEEEESGEALGDYNSDEDDEVELPNGEDDEEDDYGNEEFMCDTCRVIYFSQLVLQA